MSWVDEIGPLSIRNMRYFVTFVESGTINGAAAALGTSSAAVRARMKTLSDAVGQQLFERSGPQLLLTEAGVRLLLTCREALGQIDEIRRDIKEMGARGLVAGNVRIGITPGIARVLMSSVVIPLLAMHPKLEMSSFEASGPTLHGWLEEGVIDLAIGMPAARHWWITDLVTYDDHLMLCSKRPLGDDVRFAEASDEAEVPAPMFGCYPLAATGPTHIDLAKPQLQMSGFLTSMAFVGMGSWCAVVPLSAVLDDVEKGALFARPIPSAQPQLRLIARHTEKPLNDAGELVLSAIGDALPVLAGRVAACLDRI